MDSSEEQVINYGKNFEMLRASDGWAQLKRVLEDFEAEAVQLLVKCTSSDWQILRSQQLAAFAIQTLKSRLESHMDAAILDANELIKNRLQKEALKEFTYNE